LQYAQYKLPVAWGGIRHACQRPAPQENSNNSKISPHWVGLIKQIDRSSLEVMLAYLKKHREQYIEIEKLERIKKLPLFGHCLLLTLFKINQNQLTSKRRHVIGNIFSKDFQKS
jgi:hypothetical protein